MPRVVEPKFAAAFAVGSVVSAFGALRFWPLAWPAVAFALIAIGYAGVGSSPFAKGADGRLHPIARIVLAPYLVIAWMVLLGLRFRSELGHHEIRPRLFIGRRPLRARELPESITLIVDLTAEFSAVRPKDVEYISVPVLDGSAPHDLEAARAIVERIKAHEGVAYVHCAAGHGRSAAIVASVLVVEGRAADVREAIAMIRCVRPGVGLSRSQRAFVRALTSTK